VGPAAGWGYQPIEADGRLHAFDYPLFWANVRANARERVAAFVGAPPPDADACPPCAENPRCVRAIAWHAFVAASFCYAGLVLLLFPCVLPCFCCIGKARRGGRRPAFDEAVACACCCPCYMGVRGWRRRRARRRRPLAAVKSGPTATPHVEQASVSTTIS
jgi:hypothetical protein